MSDLASFFVQAALVVLIVLLFPIAYRVFVGPRPADRLQAIETGNTILIGIVILLTLVQESSFVLDIGIALATFSFISTLGIARFLSHGRVF